jgi:hypothetical protein
MVEKFLVNGNTHEVDMIEPVKKSSNIHSAGFVPKGIDGEFKLVVKFHNGGSYAYKKVTKKHFDDLINAESAGSYFGKTIRTKPFIKIFGTPIK